MRCRESCDGLTVTAIAGTRVVLIAMDITDKLRKGLLGFTIWRTGPDPANPKRQVTIPLKGGMHFEAADAWIDVKERARLTGQSDRHPIQSFVWGDYVAAPGTDYEYKVVARYGKPGALTEGATVTLRVSTEENDLGTHAVYFNRGVAGSQAYARKFHAHKRYYKKMGRWQGFIRPSDVPDHEAYRWLSRGLEEAMLDFVAQAKDETYSLRVAAFEFTYKPFIDALVSALERGVDVQATYHAAQSTEAVLKGGSRTAAFIDKRETITKDDWKKLRAKVKQEDVDDSTAAENHEAIGGMSFVNPDNEKRVNKMLKPRKNTGGFSHNKVIILLKDGKPVQVWTGSTNYTEGGIFGQSNVGHIVRDPKVAQAYLDYWEQLHADATHKDLGVWTVEKQGDISGEPPVGVTPVFSPRKDDAMLDWYAERFGAAKQSVHFTAAFSVASQIYAEAVKETGAELRYLMLEKRKAEEPLASMKKAHPKAPSLDTIDRNRIAWGDTLEVLDEDEEDMIEVLTGLNTFVDYLHTKYMLVDPLSEDPLVITGSANFSTNSTVNNDENMLVIRGDTRVADIYLGEFMRLFNHFRMRNELNEMTREHIEHTNHLDVTDGWTKEHFKKGGQLWKERKLFAGAHVAEAARG